MSAELSVVPGGDERKSILSELEDLAWSLCDELSNRRKRPISHLLCEMGRYLSFHFESAPSVKLNEDDLDEPLYQLFDAIADGNLRDAELAVWDILRRAGLL